MQFPNTHDTILAVASPWRPSPIGIVRLSGPRAIAVVESLITGARERPAGPRRRGVEPVSIAPCPDVVLPADVFRFPGPHSATGQDVAEIHAPGNLPLLRALLDRLVAAGARRALPGEFTARAYLNGKIDAAGAAAVLELIHATDASAAQAAMRLALGTSVDAAHVETRLLALLARIEADIDFVDEEDVSSLSAAQVRGALTTLIADVDRLRAGRAIERRHRRPHVALVGLPNAGKSTLFNALLGRRRAIVAPLEGTTRDVLSAEIELGGREIVLQDCAGLGSSADEIELAAHRAAEQAADFADAIVWVHDAGRPWGERERGLLARFDAARTIVVLSKLDECESDSFADIGGPAIRTSAVLHNGLTELSSAIAERIGQCSPGGFGVTPDWTAVAAALGRAAEATGPELIAIDVRGALSEIRRAAKLPLAEDVLGFIFTQFCIGK